MNSKIDKNTSSIIVVDKLSKTVSSKNNPLTILSSVSFRIKHAESVAIMGTSGSGKSTLLSLLAGLDVASSGFIEVLGQSMGELGEDGRAALRNQVIGFVFQSFQLLPNLNTLENVMLPLELAGDKNARQLASDLLDRVGLSARLTHIPSQLSGGEQQRVALARAFVTQPKILFADEPTGNLDSTTGDNIIDLLFELNKEKQTTLVLVTHDLRLAERCERIIELKAGCIV
ncbi:MAG: ABC transporter ATP-binding protein [Gammaproteobacteria bacterium]|jgi:putative ABC transport system ATP-binding protein|nr:ABC transporter ATP-binding protein [Gammaproteobacteria bacterium]MBT4147333.1 ABC transporter ATP-binding protein [Gammaproteobacteria bacterium]MBT5222498.1 ABC transporter ATP-binding protein [Gammaproteobacteria bacterium]MBT5825390.1 ABC transporter ATP-binding protein [Gammaproteobacteria bacterium]MBT6419030.1 ABC transporter ATP-binding protein [Gammaproteobacteria bacterium]